MVPLTKLLCVEYFSNVKCTTVRFNLLPQTKVVHGAVFGARPKQQDAELTVSALFLLKKRKVVSPRSALLSA
jgi:hypothetical protein